VQDLNNQITVLNGQEGQQNKIKSEFDVIYEEALKELE